MVQSAAIAGVVPFLGSSAANAAPKMEADSYAPIVTIFDARGCPRGGSEYSGEKAGDQDDDMAVKVASRKVIFLHRSSGLIQLPFSFLFFLRIFMHGHLDMAANRRAVLHYLC